MRSSVLGVAALVAAGLLAACGGTPSKPHPITTPDAGHVTGGQVTGSGTAGGCSHDGECSAHEYCINGRCGTCNGSPPLACPNGQSCNVSTGACMETSGAGSTSAAGSSGTNGGSTGLSGTSTTGTSGTPCDHRSDCTGAEACLGLPDAGECGSPAADAGCNTSDACVKGYICQAHSCVFGCLNNLDCHGTPEPVCVPGNPGHCGPCSQSSQCETGEVCTGGQCVTGQACTSASGCSGGQGCVSGVCGPCTADGDCGAGQLCDTSSGVCSTPAGCSSDAECQSLHAGSPAWWCSPVPDGGLDACALGCVADSLCSTPQAGCCNLANGQTCNTSTHRCETSQTTSATTSTSSTTGTTATTATTLGTSTGSTASDTTGTSATSTTASSTSGTTGTSATSTTGTTATSTTGSTATSTTGTSTTGTSTTGTSTTGGSYCQGCSKNGDCPSGSYCLLDPSSSLGGSCTAKCSSSGTCSQPNAMCYQLYDNNGNPAGTGCAPISGSCTDSTDGDYCQSCTDDSQCSSGYCGVDDNGNGSCVKPCDVNGNCPESGSSCQYICDYSDDCFVYDPVQVCFPNSGVCN